MSATPSPLDLRADHHGHFAEFVNDQDRRWFARHPLAVGYDRPAFEHEFCDPRHLPQCVPVFEVPAGAVLHVHVRKHTAWARTRQPFLVAGTS